MESQRGQSWRWSRASFRSSLVPMVIADDERRYLAANPAACLLLRMSEEEVRRLRIDDLAPPGSEREVAQLWASFLREGVQYGTFELCAPDGTRVAIDYSAAANVEPGRHLAIWVFPADESVDGSSAAVPEKALLTSRERQVLGMVAMGRGTSWIAADLGVSASTVESHVRHCLEKLGARNRAHAISLGVLSGEITLEFEPPDP